jgi:hypothetical protein
VFFTSFGLFFHHIYLINTEKFCFVAYFLIKMLTNHQLIDSNEKANLESCKQIVLLARYRVEEDDLSEAMTLFQEALMLTNPTHYHEEEYKEAICRLRCDIFLELGDLLIRMGRLQKA